MASFVSSASLSSSSSSSSSPSKPSNAGDSYIGSFISLISKYEIRYEGVLYVLSVQDSTIGLKNVRSYGTEGRKKDGPQIPSSDKVYEFILFRGSDIKDLQVKTSPPAQTEESIHDDPAIIQSQCAGFPSSSSALASINGKTLAEAAQCQDMPTLTSRPYLTALPSFHSVNHVTSTNPSEATENSGQSFSMPMYWQGHNGSSINMSDALQQSIPFQTPAMVCSSLSAQKQMQVSGLEDSPVMGLSNASEFVTPSTCAASDFFNPNSIMSVPVQYSASHNMLSSSAVKTSLPSSATYTSTSRLIAPSFPYSSLDIGITNTQNVTECVFDPIIAHPTQSTHYPASLYGASTSSSLLTPTPFLLSPDQLTQSRSYVIPSMVYPEKNLGPLSSLSSTSLPLISNPASQEPLLPLPSSEQKHANLSMQFTEEFDFEAMNEKFKKDEVWGYLGNTKQKEKTDGLENNSIDQSLEDKENPRLVLNFDAKPAYNKDDFFDTISCNSLSRLRNGQNRFSDRMKQDTETFGIQRTNLGYGGYGPGRGNNYHDRHNWGRGYGFGGRGNGNFSF